MLLHYNFGHPYPINFKNKKDRKMAGITLQVESFVNYNRRQKENF